MSEPQEAYIWEYEKNGGKLYLESTERPKGLFAPTVRYEGSSERTMLNGYFPLDVAQEMLDRVGDDGVAEKYLEPAEERERRRRDEFLSKTGWKRTGRELTWGEYVKETGWSEPIHPPHTPVT